LRIDSVTARAPRSPAPLCVILYLGLCVATALVWEPAHDEGITWYQAIGHLDLLRTSSEPIPIARLYAVVDGASSLSAGGVIEGLMESGGMHPPAYYLGLRGWSRLAGTRRLALVAPALVLGVFSLFGIRRLARLLLPGERAGDWAMLISALSPWLVGYSVLARPYALVLCLAIWSTLAVLAMGAAEGRRAWRALFVLLSLLGLYTLYHYALVLAWQLSLLGLRALRLQSGRRPALLELACVVACIAAGFAPWVPRLLVHLQVTGEAEYYFSGLVPLGRWPEFAWRLVSLFGLGESVSGAGGEWLQLAFAGLVLCTLVLLIRGLLFAGGAPVDSEARLLWQSLPLLPVLIACADWLRDTHTLFITKTSFALFPFLVLAAVHGWLQLERRWLRLLGLCAISFLLAAAVASSLYTRRVVKTPFEQVAAYLRETDRESHVVALSSIYPGYSFPLLLSLRKAGVENVRLVFAPWRRLEAVVEDGAASPAVERLTLLNLDVDYDADQTWQADLLQRIESRARGAGFGVRVMGPAAAAAAAAGGEGRGRPLWIVTPVRVKYFSM
jgi:hypothetical protein